MKTEWMTQRFLTTLLFLAGAGFGHGSAAAAGEPAGVELTSTNLVEWVDRSAEVRAGRLDVAASEEKKRSWTQSLLPRVSAGVGMEHFRKGRDEVRTQPEFGVEAEVNLWNAGRDVMGQRVRELLAAEETAKSRLIRARVWSEAAAHYWRALYLREWTLVLKQAQDLNAASLKAADRRIAGGLATRVDRLEFEMQAAELDRAIREATSEFRAEVDQLAALLEITAPLQLNEKFEHLHDFESELGQHPDAMAAYSAEAELTAQRLELESERSYRVFWPRLEAVAGYRQPTQLEEDPPDAADRTEAYVGLKLKMDLSAGFEEAREARAGALRAQAQRLRAERLKRETEVHFKTEMNELRRLHDQVHDFEENIARAETYHRLALGEYARGVKNSPDVLGANLKLLEARQKRLASIRDFQVAKSHLKAKFAGTDR